MSLDGKTALITGSSRGIGRGIAPALAESGVKVGVHYFQNQAAAKETLEQIRKRGSYGFLVQADVTQPKQITEMFRKLKTEFGHLDIFISNARPEASKFFQPPLDITLEQWDAAFDSQGKAFLVGVREALPLMQDGGRIFAITYAEGSRHRWPSTMGRHGCSESLARITGQVLRCSRGEARGHGERNQPGMDRGQRLEHTAGTGTETDSELAHPRLDADGTLGNAGGHRRRGCTLLFGESAVDYGTGDLCRWRRIFDESGSPSRNPNRII